MNEKKKKKIIKYFSNNKINQALQITDKTDIGLLSKFSLIFIKNKKYENAIKLFNKILLLDKNNIFALVNKGNALSNLSKHQEAIQCYDQALKINPRLKQAWNNEGTALSALGKHQEAIKCYDKSLKINPKDEQVWYNKGITLGDLGKKQEAIKCYDQALKINPNSEQAWNNKGTALIALGKKQESIKCYDKALKINPNSEQAYYNKGNALIALGKKQEAIDCFDQALKINPKYEQAYYNKGTALSALGKHQEAIKCYDQALKINPKNEQVCNNKGTALIALGKHQEAIKYYDQALKINPKYGQAWYNKGNELSTLGKKQEAIKCYDKALKINPKYEKAWNNKGTALSALEKHKEAIKCYDQALKINPLLVESYANKGIIYINQHKYKKANEFLNKAKELFKLTKRIEDANKISDIEDKSKNSYSLLIKLRRIDKRFKNCIKSKKINLLKRRSKKLSENINNILKEFETKKLFPDVLELLRSKTLCFNYLFHALELKKKLNLKKLKDVKKTFEKWKLYKLSRAVDNLINFISTIRKYNTLNEFTDNEEKILLQKLNPTEVLDGVLTEEIKSKIKGKYFESKSIEDKTRDESDPYFFEHTTVNKVRIAMVQLDYTLIPRTQPFGYLLQKDSKENIKSKILSALRIANNEKVNIICFPELCLKEDWISDIINLYEDIFIIGGSYYDNNRYNVCPIIYKGTIRYIKKINPSPPFERIGGSYGMKSGEIEPKIFQTRYGKILVCICYDFDEWYMKKIDKFYDSDFIINPRYDYNKEHRFQNKIDPIILDYRLSNYYIFINAKYIEFDGKKGGGGSSILCLENDTRISTFKKYGLRPYDSIKSKLCELKNEMICIADFDITKRGQGRVDIINLYQYSDNNKKWGSLPNQKIW